MDEMDKEEGGAAKESLSTKRERDQWAGLRLRARNL